MGWQAPHLLRYGHAAPPMMSVPEPARAVLVAADVGLFAWTNALICAAVAPLEGIRPGSLREPPVLFWLLIRMFAEACQAVGALTIVFARPPAPPTSAHQLFDAP